MNPLQPFGRYYPIKMIGRGGMAEVWEAKRQGPEGFEQTVALKRIDPRLAAQPGLVALFISEAKMAATLRHPNIVHILDFGSTPNRDYFLAMEFVEGANLAALRDGVLRGGGKLPLEAVLYIGAEIATALAHAHDASIVHRDVSPHNVLISLDGEVKVTDFGIAKSNVSPEEEEGTIRGKLPYLSPEQAAGLAVDRRTDLFSLGVVLYELLVGEGLFPPGPAKRTLDEIRDFERVDAFIASQLPAAVRRVLLRTLVPDASGRFDNAAEMARALEQALGPGGRSDGRNYLRYFMGELFDQVAASPASPASPPSPASSTSAAPALSELIALQTRHSGTRVGDTPIATDADRPDRPRRTPWWKRLFRRR